eukprot:6923792-Lingulodinium_polyedra.AAC.1
MKAGWAGVEEGGDGNDDDSTCDSTWDYRDGERGGNQQDGSGGEGEGGDEEQPDAEHDPPDERSARPGGAGSPDAAMDHAAQPRQPGGSSGTQQPAGTQQPP